MSVGFRAVQWNRHKLIYDALLLGAVALYLLVYLIAGPAVSPDAARVTWEIQEIRATGSCAFFMLVVILAIGPIVRTAPSLLPLLYNRRHFGVLTCLMAVIHAWLVLDWYHGNGKLTPFLSLLTSSAHYLSFTGFPFEILGLLALLILLVMAATSHDFWLSLLTPPVWKAIHMAVYGALALLVAHIALGALQSERSTIVTSLLFASVVVLGFLHWDASTRETLIDRYAAQEGEWLDIGAPDEIPEGRAHIVVPKEGERIAIFRHNSTLSAVSNVCAHQNGPLGEGKIIDGCITCPWHGFQFRPEDGCAPAPFTDKIATYRLKRAGERILVHSVPQPPGTRVEPLRLRTRT